MLPQSADEATEQLGVLDILIVLAVHKKLILGATIGAALVTAAITLALPNIYTGSAKIVVPQQNQSVALAMLAQFGPLGSVAGGALGIKNPNDLYVGLLKSRTISDRIIERFELRKLYERRSLLPVEKTLLKVREQLEDSARIEAADNGIITIDVEERDPKLAASIANAYVDELDKLNQTLALGDASQRRIYYEKQLKVAKDSLVKAETELQKIQESTGMIKLDDQGRAIIEMVAALRGQIAAKEIQIAALRSFATEQNSEYIRARQELAGLKAELAKAERSNVSGQGDILIPTGKIPGVAVEYIRGFREVKYNETVFELLAKQYELARIDEAREMPTIQIVDRAVEPDDKTKPKRGLIVALVTLVTFVLIAFWVLVRESAYRTTRDIAERLTELKGLLGWRRV